MKKALLFILVTILFTFSAQSWARTRWYRINPETVTYNGYAIAWGVRDVPVDFEEIEQSQDSINEFLQKYDNMIVNYLVDIQRETILAEIPSTSFFGHLGNIRLGNQYSISLYEIPNAEGLEENQTALVMTQNWKWDNSFTDAYLIEKSNTTTHMIRHYDMKDDVFQELKSALTVSQRKTLENKALIYELSTDGGSIPYHLQIEGYIPKCESNCEYVDIEADPIFTVTADSFKMGLTNLKLEIHKE